MKPLIFLLFLCSFSVINSQETELSLMTYNIRLDIDSDGENAWKHRKDFVINQIKFYEPSIFGIQEGLPQQVNYLNENLSEYSYIGEGRDGENNGEHSAIFYNKNLFEVLSSETFWLSTTPTIPSKSWDAAYPRIYTYALFKNKNSRVKFWVFNTHFDHIGQESRLNAIEMIIEKIQSENTQNYPVFFMGDLNVEPDNEVIAKLNKYMIDSFDVSIAKPFGPYETFNGFKFQEPPKYRLDYIYVSKSDALEVLKYAVLSDSKNLKYPSDHFPVFIKVALH